MKKIEIWDVFTGAYHTHNAHLQKEAYPLCIEGGALLARCRSCAALLFDLTFNSLRSFGAYYDNSLLPTAP